MKAARETSRYFLGAPKGQGIGLKLSGIRIAAGQYSENGHKPDEALLGTGTEDLLLRGGVPVDLSPFFCICVTNNNELTGSVKNVKYIRGSALSVLMEGRDLIHLGLRLAASPLYGNFKPDQQPYRTLILFLDRDLAEKEIDTSSLAMIDSAIRIWSETKLKTVSDEINEEVDGDLRFVDYALIEGTLKSCGLLSRAIKRAVRR